jgi:lipopolysaccharide/colanic/teichoic acid biosynthesis glycosyltransferase
MVNTEKTEIKSRVFFLTDILIVLSIFCLANYIKFRIFIPQGSYLGLFIMFLLYWVFFSLYYKKYKEIIHRPFWFAWRLIFWSTVLSFFFITLTVSIANLWSVSRVFIIIVTLCITAFETVFLLLYKIVQHAVKPNYISTKQDKKHLPSGVFHLRWLIPGALLIFGIYFTFIWFRTGIIIYKPWNEQALLVLLSSWGLSTILTRRYTAPTHQNAFYEIAPYIKAGLLMLLFIGVFYFFLRLDSLSRTIIFSTSVMHSALEIPIFFLYFFGGNLSENKRKILPDTENINILGQEPLNIKTDIQPDEKLRFKQKLTSIFQRIYLPYKNELYHFLSKHLPIEKAEKDEMRLFNTVSLINVQILKNKSISLLINLYKLNNIRRLNVYLLTCYNKISPGGLIVGCFEPLEMIRNRLRSEMPRFLFIMLYPFHFIFYRVFPKLPGTKQLYFILTKGEKRVLSKAEVFGRLSFCGYQLIKEKIFGDKLYFICEKIKTVSPEEYPSYHPIVRLKRIGLNGEMITIFKFRTMHPYSEFIQKEIYDEYHLDSFGKMRNDYRLTQWGKILRRCFIDELPQIYNWLKGDLKLVGVRALSEQYFSLYPKDMQKLRIKSKPGLVPPYYADTPQSFDEIVESERKYLKQKHEHPIKTDLIYFFRAIINIVFRGARSQ